MVQRQKHDNLVLVFTSFGFNQTDISDGHGQNPNDLSNETNIDESHHSGTLDSSRARNIQIIVRLLDPFPTLNKLQLSQRISNELVEILKDS